MSENWCAYLGRYGDNRVTEDAKICFPPPGTQADRNVHICMHYTGAQRVGSHFEGNGTNRAGTYRVSVAKYTILPCFVCS